jgi:Fic family protein
MSFSAMRPYDLPLLPPAVDWHDERFVRRVAEARTQLGELKGYSFGMPNPLLLFAPALLRESVASSSIENINTTVERVLQLQLFPERERRQPDKEVLRYRDALLWGYEQMKSVPLSTRLILGIHQRLVPDGAPGYRRTQNSIQNSVTGETLYSPPAASQIDRLMSNWENFLHSKGDGIDPVIKCAVAHYQFEAIHPFGDGNGRVGRILMVLYLIQEQLLGQPTLFLSGYINRNRGEYYRVLLGVSEIQAWPELVLFLLDAVCQQAAETKQTFFRVMELRRELREAIRNEHRKIYSADLVDCLFSYPVITPVKLGQILGMHYTTATRHLTALSKAGILKDAFHKKYHLFVNHRLMEIIGV